MQSLTIAGWANGTVREGEGATRAPMIGGLVANLVEQAVGARFPSRGINQETGLPQLIDEIRDGLLSHRADLLVDRKEVGHYWIRRPMMLMSPVTPAPPADSVMMTAVLGEQTLGG